jgi:hypothetical protein
MATECQCEGKESSPAGGDVWATNGTLIAGDLARRGSSAKVLHLDQHSEGHVLMADKVVWGLNLQPNRRWRDGRNGLVFKGNPIADRGHVTKLSARR